MKRNRQKPANLGIAVKVTSETFDEVSAFARDREWSISQAARHLIEKGLAVYRMVQFPNAPVVPFPKAVENQPQGSDAA
jgi:hypothetical protein